MLYRNVFVLKKLLKLHSVQQSFVNTVSNPAAERPCVVVFLHFPDRDGIDRDRKGTPRAGLICAILLVLVLSTIGTFELLVRIMTFISLLVDGVVILALFRLRRTMSDASRPFRIPWYPYLPIVVALMYATVIAMVSATQPELALGGGAVLVVVLVAGVLLTRRRPRTT